MRSLAQTPEDPDVGVVIWGAVVAQLPEAGLRAQAEVGPGSADPGPMLPGGALEERGFVASDGRRWPAGRGRCHGQGDCQCARQPVAAATSASPGWHRDAIDGDGRAGYQARRPLDDEASSSAAERSSNCGQNWQSGQMHRSIGQRVAAE